MIPCLSWISNADVMFHLLNRKDGTKATTTLVKRIGGDKDLFINELRVVIDILLFDIMLAEQWKLMETEFVR